jgi:uncharacterized membrane protein
VIVGEAVRNSPYEHLAFRWTSAEDMQSLGTLPGSDDNVAKAVSGDGLVVVGGSYGPASSKCFRWTSGTGMMDMGVPSGMDGCGAWAISSDGKVILVDAALESSGQEAEWFLWTETEGFYPVGSIPGRKLQ